MTPDVMAFILVGFIIGIPLLVFLGWAVYEGIQGALENRHRRKLELLREQQKEREAIDKAWDETFGKEDAG